jgi:triosephosphate isomerase
MPQRKLIAANWKMNKGIVESETFADEMKSYFDKTKNLNCDVILCPPFTSIHLVYKRTNGTDIKLGAQNVHYETNGAFTGEIS